MKDNFWEDFLIQNTNNSVYWLLIDSITKYPQIGNLENIWILYKI